MKRLAFILLLGATPAVALAPPVPGVQDLRALLERTAATGLRKLYLPPGVYAFGSGPITLPYRGVNEIIGSDDHARSKILWRT